MSKQISNEKMITMIDASVEKVVATLCEASSTNQPIKSLDHLKITNPIVKCFGEFIKTGMPVNAWETATVYMRRQLSDGVELARAKGEINENVYAIVKDPRLSGSDISTIGLRTEFKKVIYKEVEKTLHATAYDSALIEQYRTVFIGGLTTLQHDFPIRPEDLIENLLRKRELNKREATIDFGVKQKT